MAIKINPWRHEVKKKSEASQRVLDALSDYLESKVQEPMRWLVRFWGDQSAVLTYKELRNIVLDEEFPKKIFNDWFGDYSRLISGRMTDLWRDSMISASMNNPLFAGTGAVFDTSDTFVRTWIADRTGEMVTNCMDEQINAIRYIVAEGRAGNWSTAEMARYIRPIIGLTEPQAAANQKYYNTVKEMTRQNHPRMTNEAVERRAREAASKYAGKQHRYRAETIARTEIATAYNQGNDQYVRQIIDRGYLPQDVKMVKVWSTADDGHVCEACQDLEGQEIDMDKDFSVVIGVNAKRTLASPLPPLHPRCKCAVMYVEKQISRGIDNPTNDDKINSRDMPNGQRRSQFYELNDEEISEIKAAASSIGVPEEVLRFNIGTSTAYVDDSQTINIRGNIYPDPEGITARDRLTPRAVLAHEYYGHYMARNTVLPPGDWHDEFRASYRAAVNTPNLTASERRDLMRDAIDRASMAGVPIKITSTIRRVLYGFE